ncbi:MAG TPA: class I SAM-dependent methyltransferase [Bacteroidales bacterium]|nr:class I SAM-dependent methyltransferase [Bacteroidales bacterium]
MRYEPIKKSIGKIISGSPALRKILYFLMDLLLLRTWHVKRALWRIARHLPEKSRILDAGSGLGQYTWRISRMNRNWRIKSVDISAEQTGNSREFFRKSGLEGRVEFQILDLTCLNEKECYNLILCVDVMEHIHDDIQVFRNFYTALKPGGFLLISTPSDMGGSDVHGDNEESFIDEHVRNGYGIDEITSKLRSAGFTGINTRYTYGRPGSLSWRLSMKYPVKMLNISYLFFILLPFYYLIFFPFSLILNTFDLYKDHKTGTGLLVTARKK